MGRGRILEVSERIAGETAGAALHDDELGFVLPEERHDALPLPEEQLGGGK